MQSLLSIESLDLSNICFSHEKQDSLKQLKRDFMEYFINEVSNQPYFRLKKIKMSFLKVRGSKSETQIEQIEQLKHLQILGRFITKLVKLDIIKPYTNLSFKVLKKKEIKIEFEKFKKENPKYFL